MAQKSVIWPCSEIEDVEAYFGGLEEAVEASSEWMLHRDPECPERVVLATYAGRGFNGEDLRMCVFECGPPKGLVHFTPRAAVWSGVPANDTIVTDEQINSAFRLFEPLARRAAKGLNIPVSIVLAKPRRFKMPKKLKMFVDGFVSLANLNGLHPYDWERFYKIVHHAHRYGVDMHPGDVARELSARGVREKMVTELSDLYDFGRSLLARTFTWE